MLGSVSATSPLCLAGRFADQLLYLLIAVSGALCWSLNRCLIRALSEAGEAEGLTSTAARMVVSVFARAFAGDARLGPPVCGLGFLG